MLTEHITHTGKYLPSRASPGQKQILGQPQQCLTRWITILMKSKNVLAQSTAKVLAKETMDFSRVGGGGGLWHMVFFPKSCPLRSGISNNG